MTKWFSLLIITFSMALTHLWSEDTATKSTEGEALPKKEDASKKPEPPKIGNFSLPTSQQPSGLFAFGGNIIDEGEIQLYFFADEFFGRNKKTSDLIPSVLFGITNAWSIYFNFPFSPILQDGCDQSGGIDDFFVQLEYAFYTRTTADYSDQATVVTNITVPTGSIHKSPNTGFGAPSFFLEVLIIGCG